MKENMINNKRHTEMKTVYQITSNEIGTILLRRRKIAKALRWWLRENGFTYTSTFFTS